MTSQLTYLAAREHVADLTRSAEQALLAGIVGKSRDDSGRRSPIARIATRLARRAARSTTGAPAVAPPGRIEP